MNPDDIFGAACKAMRYRPDDGDHWQTPAETLERGTGDCEDFAILCWWWLRDLPGESRLGFVLLGSGDAHMVCLYLPPGEEDPWVFDVTADVVHRMSERDCYFSLAITLGLKEGRPFGWIGLGGKQLPGPHGRWADVLKRMGIIQS